MTERREMIMQVNESGGVSVDSFIEMSDVLLAAGPGRVRVTIEAADATDAVLTWLEHEASDARRVLVAERDPGNIEIMRQWVYHHECMVRKRLDELGLLDVDDEPAGGERR